MKHVISTSFCVRGRDQGRVNKCWKYLSSVPSLDAGAGNYQDQQSTICFVELAISYFVQPVQDNGLCSGLSPSTKHTGWDQVCPPSQDKGKQLQNKKQEEFQEEAVVCPCHQTGLCPWGLSLCLVAGSRLARLEHSSFLDHLLPEELASLDFPSHQETVSIACSSCFPR